jgi:signal transduction histidine kinase
MTLRSKLTIWYSGILSISCLVVCAGLYYELVLEPRLKHASSHDSVSSEIGEILVYYAVPAIIVTIVGGWWLTRRALSPVQKLTAAASRMGLQNLGEQLPRTGNHDEIDRLAEVFNSMFRRLQDSFNREREFMLHASHELKTPLSVIRAQIETALSDVVFTGEQRELLQSHLEEIVRFAGLVDSLSFLAKADAGMLPLNRSSIALDELVDEVIEDTRVLAYPRDISVLCRHCDKLAVEGDRHRLRQLLLNLSENAVKHNIEHGRVEFSLLRIGPQARLSIRNTSQGIAPEQLDRVFEPFFRAENARKQNTDGSGLGLSIARWIVQSHQGEISIASQPGEWTEVTVLFPLLEAGP